MDLSKYKKGVFLLVNKELAEVPSLLKDGENFKMIVNGQVNNRQGLLVLTDMRVFWFAKRMFGGTDFSEISLQKVAGASVRRDGISNKVSITYSGGSIDVLVADSKVANEFATETQVKEDVKQVALVQTDDLIDKLERLAALKEKGILTESEFLNQKAVLLNS